MNCKLFDGICQSDLSELLADLKATTMVCQKNEVLLHAGEVVKDIYICTSGAFQVQTVGSNGDVAIISHISEGGYFGGAFAFTEKISPADLISVAKSSVLKISAKSIINLPDSHKNKSKILFNLIGILADKSSFLVTKIQHLSARSIRAKMISFLNTMEVQNGKKEFFIPFDRQGLADYLCVDRVALSKELSKMQAENLIEFNKNHFVLKY